MLHKIEGGAGAGESAQGGRGMTVPTMADYQSWVEANIAMHARQEARQIERNLAFGLYHPCRARDGLAHMTLGQAIERLRDQRALAKAPMRDQQNVPAAIWEVGFRTWCEELAALAEESLATL